MRDFLSAPILADISVTNHCNLRCDYCYASAGEKYIDTQELTVDEYKNLFQQLDELKVHRISLTGGEPFIRSDFFEILEAAQVHNFAIIINSNGTFISDEVAQKLKTYRIDRICITIDGSCSEVHDAIRGTGTFIAALNGIRNLQKYNLPVSTLFTLNKNNIHDLVSTIKLNDLLGINYMSVMVMCPTGRASKGELLITKELWYPVFLEISEMLEKNEIKLHFKIVPPNESNIFWLFYFPLKFYNKLNLLPLWNQNENEIEEKEISCQAGIKAISIMCNGDVYGCDLMIGIDELKAGNIRNNNIKEIWNNSEAFIKLRNIEVENLTGKCGECNYIWCGGGCRSAAYNLDNSIFGSDKSCFECED